MFENLGRVMTSAEHTLKFECRRCGRQARWTRADAFFVFGEDAAPFDVRRRARCGACGERARIVISI
jgi:ribosomal protein L37E